MQNVECKGLNEAANLGKSFVYLVRTGDNGVQKSKKVHR
jgi:hypothetical protein